MNSVKRSKGFSMIEVLVALLIIAVGVLGAVALQTRAVQAGMESYQRTQALLLVEDMMARLKNNKAHVSTCYAAVGRGTTAYLGSGVSTAPSGCNTVADADLAAWHGLLLGAAEIQGSGSSAQQVGGILNARGCIDPLVANGEFRVSVAWQGMSKLASSTDKNACAQGAYEHDDYRRVVGVTLRITDLR